MKRVRPVVAIDGPAGAGKSTVSRLVASRLGYFLLDTGALYRCVALAADRAEINVDPSGKSEAQATADAQQVAQLARELAARDAIRFDNDALGVQRVFIESEDVSQAIRTPEISQGASKASTIPEVRSALLEMQRRVGRGGGVVVEGRDIGTVVFPDAEAKFFLTASATERAARRFKELSERGPAPSLAEVKSEVDERDRRDSGRPIAPLAQAADAELLDSTGLGIEAVVDRIVTRVREVEAELAKAQP